MQATLFDGLARSTDPETSRLAALGRDPSLEERVLHAFRVAGRHGLTADEACRRVLGEDRRRDATVKSLVSRLKRGEEPRIVDAKVCRRSELGRDQQVFVAAGL